MMMPMMMVTMVNLHREVSHPLRIQLLYGRNITRSIILGIVVRVIILLSSLGSENRLSMVDALIERVGRE